MFKFIIDETKLLYNHKYNFLKNKNILITGSNGLIGHYLTAFFFNNINGKFPIDNLVLTYNSFLPKYFSILKKNKKIKIVKIDLTKKITNQINLKFDYIFHLASYGQPDKFTSNPLKTFKLNTETITNLMKFVRTQGKFFYFSSSEIYSGLNGNISEDKIGTVNTEHDRACYIFSKLGGETLLSIFNKINKIDYKIIRLCLAYGPGTKKNDTRVLNQFIHRSLFRKKINLMDNGLSLRRYIYISDTLKMILNICFFGKNKIYNVGGKKTVSIKKLAEIIATIQNKKISLPINLKKRQKGAPKNAFVSIGKYEKEFGKFKMTNLKSGLKKTIDWQKKLYEKKN
jgi:UDP-glucuronate decarboxylase